MDIIEVSGFRTGVDRSGVSFLEPKDAFETINNGYIYRQRLLTRKGFQQFGNRLSDGTRVLGIFENVLPNGIRELLVISSEFLYRYNSGTNQFDQITNAGSAPVGGFGITFPDQYVSGTTYLTKTGAQRFLFTGIGLTDVYFYDGIDVKSFTLDNPDYVPFSVTAPFQGALQLYWFGERINFLGPLLGGTRNFQGILYSGIRDSAGNGDKFNVPGSGIIAADTYEAMKGGAISGDILVVNFQRSNWILEKTRDENNPYFFRKIPSVLGTDAGFSTVAWNYEIKSLGETGLISTDGRKSLRFDNKIPFFTRDDIDQDAISYTYGGFDRVNGQFLFSYRSSASGLAEDTQDKVLVYNYEESTWAFNDQRFSCFGQAEAGLYLTWDEIDQTIEPSWLRWDTTEEIWNDIGVERNKQKTLAGDNLGFIYEINEDFDDYYATITGITQAAQGTVTVNASGFQPGDKVVFENVQGMTEINGIIATVFSATTTSVVVNWNTTQYGLYTSGGSLSKVIDFYAEMTPLNPYRAQGKKVNLSHIEFLLDKYNGGMNASVTLDEEEYAFKTAPLITNSNYVNQIVGITQAQEAVVTLDPSFLSVGETVIFSSVVGMTEINFLTGVILDKTGTTITVDIDTSAFTAYTLGGIVQVQNTSTASKEWITMIVNQEANFITLRLFTDSYATQTIITAIRFHLRPGGFTEG